MKMIREERTRMMQKFAVSLGGLMLLVPTLAFAERPEIDCNTLPDEQVQEFYELSGLMASAAEEKNFEEALSLGVKAMSMCTTDVYTEYTLARVYQLTNDCASAYYHYDVLDRKPAGIKSENADIYKGVKKNFKEVKSKCGDVLPVEITCAQEGVEIAITGLANVSTIKCPFYGRMPAGSYPFVATKEGFQPRKDTLNVAPEGVTLTIPELKDADSTGFIRVRCPRGASKFIMTDSEGRVEEYVCPWEGEVPADTYKIRLGGTEAEEDVTVVVEKKARMEHVIPNTARTNCSAAPLANTASTAAGAVLAMLAMFGLGTLRRRRANSAK